MQKIEELKYFLLFMAVFLLFPFAVQGQNITDKKINLNIENTSIETSLAEIEKQSGIKFAYSEAAINKYASARVSIAKDNISVKDAIAQTLNNTNLTYSQSGNQIMIKEKPASSSTQSPQQKGYGSLTGTVLDESGETVIGAVVSVPGTTIGTATDADGKYTLQGIPAGTAQIQFSYMGYETQLITDVKINANRTTPLDIVMKEGSTELNEVVVTGTSYKAANEAGVLKIQQTAAQVSSVISARQIGKTSDKNLGEALKRVTGISTMDNKYVVVRGLGERWNQASLDGVTLPSSEPSNKAFSFDLIPTNIIDNVVVSKSPMPDQNATFAGGFVQISTKAIPDENFITLSVGGTWNSVSTGKIQYGRELGSMDWLGFDDGRRKWPTGLRPNF